MTGTVKLLALLASLCGLLAGSGDLSAARARATLGISALVAANCVIDTSVGTSRGLPAAASLSPDVTGNGTVATTCSCGSTPRVTLDGPTSSGCTVLLNTDADASPPTCGEEVASTFTIYAPGQDGHPGCDEALVATVTF